ncbi:hypothetical protein CVT24_001196 [Panaeolus cyanescens]|uniref:F-box domain-containing protein n=1 Tax=Panaeolus cyanescens TaxID=181874 RepID=A0A409W6W9_9AGAR|nr:hypothetical protein CVT24_001196 [Panaeolus cyanescens]
MAEIMEILPAGLLHLQNLESISWYPYPLYEDEWAYTAMYQLLASVPVLHHLELSLYFNKSGARRLTLEIPFDKMQSLTSLKVTGIWTGQDKNLKSLSSIIHQLSNLEELYLGFQHPMFDQSSSEAEALNVLNALLVDYPADAVPLKLKSLTLRQTILVMTPSILPHLRLLTHLRLEPLVVFDNTMLSLNKLWHTLKVENIYLDYLATTFPGSGLLAYLNSYSTLKGFRLARYEDATPETIEPIQLFEALLNHAGSLEEVDVARASLIDYGDMYGLWCATLPANASVYGNLRQLRKARVGVKGLRRRSTVPGSIEDSRLSMVFNTFRSLPHLKQLIIDTEEDSLSYGPHDLPHRPDYNPHKIAAVAVRTFIRSIRIPLHQDARPFEPFTIEYDAEIYFPRRVMDEGMEYWVYDGANLGVEYDDTAFIWKRYHLDQLDATAARRI